MLLNKTKCVCGKELLNEQFINYIPNKDVEFYGGRVEMRGTYNCECGRQLEGYFEKNEEGNLKLIDLEIVADVNSQNEDIKNIATSLSYKELQEYAKSKGIDKVNVKREELISQLCL